jgi:hypothetical protein
MNNDESWPTEVPRTEMRAGLLITGCFCEMLRIGVKRTTEEMETSEVDGREREAKANAYSGD